MHKHSTIHKTGLGALLLQKTQARKAVTTAPMSASLDFGPHVRVVGPGAETPESAGLKGRALADAQIKRIYSTSVR